MKKVALIFNIICLAFIVNAQKPQYKKAPPPYNDPGEIFLEASPSPNILDPNGDGWSTACGCPYSTNDGDGENEIDWVRIPNGSIEDPYGDLSTGASCGQSDITDDPDRDDGALFLNFTDLDGIPDNGDEYFLFRIRMAQVPKGAFGYSILLDTDSKFGFGGGSVPPDPNACAGNAGFELEIQVKSGGSDGVYIYDVDGVCTGPGTIMGTYDLATHTQRVGALVTDPFCTGLPIFYDFWVPYSSLGISSSTPLAAFAATSSSPGSVLGGSASDIGGINDNLFSNQDSMFIAASNAFIRTSPNDLALGCFDTTKTSTPTVNALLDTSSTISGTMNEADSARVWVLLNGDSLGLALVTSNAWTFTLPVTVTLKEGDLLSVYGDADCETFSDTSSAVRVDGNHIFINELVIDGTNEWIELYNDASYPVDISCYRICDGDFCVTLPSVTTIPATGFITIGTEPGVDINTSTCGCVDGAFDLDNTAEQLVLFDVSLNIEEAIKWGGGDLGADGTATASALGTCPAFSETIPASTHPKYKDVGAAAGFNCGKSRHTDASTTWASRCDPDKTFKASNNTVLNTKPVAVDDAASTDEDNDKSVSVQINDNDPDGDPLTTTIINPLASNGTASVIAGSIIYYSPNPNFFGIDTVTYMICDTGDAMLCDTAIVVITVNSINDVPIAGDDYVLTGENTPATVNVFANDSDVESDPFSSTIITNGSNGTALDNSDGTFTYTPNASYIGVDIVTYKICEDAAPTICDTATFTINVGLPCLIINEIDYGSSGSNGEWVELYNTCCFPVDISCYAIADGDFVMTVPASTTIAASDYYVMGNTGSAGSIDLKAGSCGGCVTEGTFGFTQSKEQLVLFSNQGVIQDAVQWGAGDQNSNETVNNNCGTSITIPKNTTAGVYENIGGIPSFVGCTGARTVDEGSTWIERCGFVVSQGYTNGSFNNKPVTVADYDTTSLSTSRVTDVQANDTEPDAELMITTITANPGFGTAVVLNSDSIDYTPTVGYVGNDFLVYQVCDTVCPALCQTDTLYLTVLGCFKTNGTGGGDYHVASTWLGGAVPGPNDCIEVMAGDSVFMNADVDINSVTINSGGVLFTAANTISISGDFTNLGTYNNANGTTVFDGTATQNIAGTNTFYNLTINNPGQVEVTALQQTVLGVLTLTQGTLDLNGNGLLFDNDNLLGGEQGRVGSGGTGTISGTVAFERSFSNCSVDGFTYFASPLHGTTFADWSDDIWITGATGAYDESGWSNVYHYSETDTGAVDSGWVAMTNISTSVTVGRGYSVYSWSSLGTAPTQIKVTGTIDLSPFTFSASFTDDLNRADSEHDGWNLMGNPYPATIDWNSGVGWTKDGCCDYVASYSPCVDDYSTYSGGVGINGGTGKIPAFQSFWIKADGSQTPNFSVTRDAIVDDNQPFFKKQATPNVLKLKISDPGSDSYDEIAFRLRKDATIKTDIVDAVKFYFPDYKPSMYTQVFGEKERYAINQLPLDGSLKELMVYTRVVKSGQYTIDISGINTFGTNICILIEDLETGTIIDPKTVSSYTFNQDAKTDYVNRFKILFGYLVNETIIPPTCSDSKDGKIIVGVDNNATGPFTYVWYNTSGNTLKEITTNSYSDTLKNIQAGNYLVSVATSDAQYCMGGNKQIKLVAPESINIKVLNFNSAGCKGTKDGVIEVEANGGTGSLNYSWSNGETSLLISSLKADLYSLTVTDSLGCFKLDTFTVSEATSVSADFSANNDTISLYTFVNDTLSTPNGGVIEFSNKSIGATNYIWNFGDGNSSSETNAKNVYRNIGNYNVSLIASNNLCADTLKTAVTVFNELILGGNELTENNGQLVLYQYGNQLNLNLKFDTPEDIVISVYSVYGKVNYSSNHKNVTNLSKVIDISHLASGIYVVSISYEGGHVAGKVYIAK